MRDAYCKTIPRQRKHVLLNGDARIDIGKAILETIISKCKDYGINTDEAFPYVDENY